MGGSGLVASFRSRANTVSPPPLSPEPTKFHFMGLLRPSPPAPAAAAAATITTTTTSIIAPPVSPTAAPTSAPAAVGGRSDDGYDVVDPTGEASAGPPVLITHLVGVNQQSKPTPYIWEKHKPVRKRRTVVNARATQRITTRMTQMMLESHLGVPAANEEVEHFRACMERLSPTYQQNWLPFGQILASTTDVPFYFSGVTFAVFFRFPDATDDQTTTTATTTTTNLPFLFCKGRETLEWAVQEILRKTGRESERADDKIIQFSGLAAVYAFDLSVRLKDFAHVRNALKRRDKIVLLVWDRRRDKPQLCASEFLARHKPESSLGWEDDASLGLRYQDKEVYPLEKLDDHCVEVKLLCVENFRPETVAELAGGGYAAKCESFAFYVRLELRHGERTICPPVISKRTAAPPVWCEWLRLSLPLSDLPLESRCVLTLFAVNLLRDEQLVYGTASCNLFDRDGWFMSGVCKLPLNASADAPALVMEMERAPYPIAFPQVPHFTPLIGRERANFKVASSVSPDPGELAALHAILKKNTLDELSEEERTLVWKYHSHCFAFPQALPKLLLSVPWEDPSAVKQAHRILETWDRLSPFTALQLLDQYYPDTVVREYAVQCLCDMTDPDLVNHLLQLIQALKFERNHDSALARFLLYRALHNRTLVGHYLFWYLKAALNGSPTDQRYLALIQVYMESCGEHADELFAQLEIVAKLRQLNEAARTYKKAERTKVLQDGLTAYTQFASFPAQFHLPINPQIVATGFVVDKCRVMDSSTAPLWLCFENQDRNGSPVLVMFKEGDDLRQDLLILQVFTEMDRLWKREGYDLHMSIYGVVSTAFNEGFIEVVSNASTCSKIQKDAAGLAGALQRTPLFNWLQKHNTTEQDISSAVQNFVHSCAAYSVASYVLGIGDRHNDNVMITREGHLFHIDFAHILGDFMKFGAYKREKAPFVFTDEFVHVMGGAVSDNYQLFVDLGAIAFNILRNNADILISLFVMMLSAGIPLLRTRKDIKFLESALALHLTEEEAAATFKGLAAEALACKTTRVLFFMHNLAHPD